jgi:CheY-like chemotaxis protein
MCPLLLLWVWDEGRASLRLSTPQLFGRNMAHVLVIDDDDFSRQMAAQILRRLGHECSAAENGAIGVTRVRRQRPDLVITDIFMPERDGIETIGEIRAIYGDMPIIAISGNATNPVSGSTNYLNIAKSFGANAALAKPLSAAALKNAIDKLLPGQASTVAESDPRSTKHA